MSWLSGLSDTSLAVNSLKVYLLSYSSPEFFIALSILSLMLSLDRWDELSLAMHWLPDQFASF